MTIDLYSIVIVGIIAYLIIQELMVLVSMVKHVTYIPLIQNDILDDIMDFISSYK